MNKNKIINIFKEYYSKHKCPSRIREYIKNNYNEIYIYLINKYSWCKTFNEIYVCLLNDINEEPKCPICGNKLKFANKLNKPYNTFCSNKCYMTNEGQNIVQNKMKKTCLNKYGCEWSFQSSNNKEKSKITSLNNWGFSHPMKSDTVKNILKNNIYDKYGVYHTGQVESIKNKIANTNLERYGVKTVLMLNKIKTKAHSKESLEKSFNTYKKNHPNGKSNIEKLTTTFLNDLFGINDVFIQFKNNLYPYHCDFYIKSLNLYIEIQGHQSHGNHPFNKNSVNDIKQVNIWKSKCNNEQYNQYNKYIEIWTLKDIEKRQCAINNKLNYIEIFSINIDYVKNVIYNYINNIKTGYKYYAEF